MIKRIITDEIIDLLNFFPAVGIIGPRQCGKTTIAKEVASRLKKETIYIDLESLSDVNILTEPELFFKNNLDKCIILDEIQRKPELFTLLRSVIDFDKKPGRFIILGSASPIIMRDSSESLAGRIAYKELSPFNLVELQDEKELLNHWIYGAYPDCYLADNKKYSEVWRDNFITSYIERDLPLLGLNVMPALIRRFWIMLANNHSGILNASSYANALDISSPTVRKYLYFLENAFLINTLQPFYKNLNKRLVKSPKIYIRDSGILHYLRQILSFSELENNIAIGHSWEGYVIEQIKELLPKHIQMYYYRTQSGAECDVVLVKGEIVSAAIEIKYSSSPSVGKGLNISIEDLESENSFIITPFSDDYMIKKNIRVCKLYDFLQKYLPKIIQ
ncbi:MAG: ATPase [Bacteroidetes bacterium GWA2_30_7]|nr:MAG: ATPase [Bacteroidetes bacterium GWA2_30_7]